MPETRLQHHFADLAKQTHAARLGMWAFLASEVLFFGALFTLYVAYSAEYSDLFHKAARHTDLILGSVNTAILITASFFVAVAVSEIRRERVRSAVWLLLAAAALGVVFLVFKGMEYAHHFSDGIYPGIYYRYAALPDEGAKIFFTLYYFMTGLHAIHVIIGVLLLCALAWMAHRGSFTPAWHTPLELGGLYWHLVDVIWIFLWPIFYLLR